MLGVDDGPFARGDEDVLVVGAVFRGGQWMDGVVSTRVSVDGLDATDKLIELVKDTRFKDLRVVMLDGIALGGFNVVDINRLYAEGGLPAIVVTRDEPDFNDIKNALENLSDSGERWKYMMDAGEPRRVPTREGESVHIQHAGLEPGDADAIVKLCSTRSAIPEPIRVAHLIAQGVVSGQSRGKA